MAQLSKKIELYAAANGVDNVEFEKDVKLRDGGSGVYIYEWNLSIDEPTAEQLATYESAATTDETLQAVLNKRAGEYKELKEQLDLLYHDMVADKGDKTGEWFKHIKAVKDANAKE
jgi:hypothetical protein